ncbi:MAG: type IV secretion system DNA-binding domain-containing protein, partial [Acidobacteriota bacterium]|nr:type IV secretion system DNA-binding domain-containing protein [Acidobacteriota bacterium]
ATMVEGRKYGIKMVLGTQNKAQFEEHYGRGAATMLSASHTKILFRCNEPESARWVADMIGEEEKERPRIGTTATVQEGGRDSINYSTFTERRSVISKEQVMALPNLHGYWKYADAVVPFRIEPQALRRVAESFIARTAPRAPTLFAESQQPEPTNQLPPQPPPPELLTVVQRPAVARADEQETEKAEHARSMTAEIEDHIDLSF